MRDINIKDAVRIKKSTAEEISALELIEAGAKGSALKMIGKKLKKLRNLESELDRFILDDPTTRDRVESIIAEKNLLREKG